MTRNRIVALAGLLLAALASPASAVQDTVTVVTAGDPREGSLDITSAAARRAVSVFNDPATRSAFGDIDLDAGEITNGSIAVVEGTARLAGTVRGDAVVINGDALLSSTTRITGDLIVLGGLVTGLDEATVEGNSSVYLAGALVRREGDTLTLLRSTQSRRSRRRREPTFDAGLHLSTGGTYNRVEGLPIEFGPRFTFGVPRATQLTLEGWAILRTGAGSVNQWGYVARGEVTFASGIPITVGARAQDVMAPVERWKLPDLHVGLASVTATEDWRDYYRRRGGAGYVEIEPLRGFTLSGEVGWFSESSELARDPFSLFGSGWRPNPSIDEGDFVTVTAGVEYDTRRDQRWGQSGWFFDFEWERGTSDSVSQVQLPTDIRPSLPTGKYTYDRLWVDVRRYQRVGRRGQFSLRGLWAGTPGGEPLPVQRRLSVGGREPMPGYEFRRFACNTSALDPSNPALCDRILVFQAEYRGSLSFTASGGSRSQERYHRRSRHDQGDWDDWFWFDGPYLVLFANAGTGWLSQNSMGSLNGDIGAGFEIGSVGIYAAKAFTNSEPLRIALRIQRRF